MQPPSKYTLKKRIYDFIDMWGHVTFYEIEEKFGSGNFMTTTEGLMNLNIVLWIGLSKESADVISELHEEEMIEYMPCDVITCAIAGNILNIPHVKTDRTKRYKIQHWLPVFIKTTVPTRGV